MPLVGTSSVWTGSEGTSVDVGFSGSVASGVTYSASGLPPGLTINPSTGYVTSVIRYTPVNPSPGGVATLAATVTGSP